MSQRIREGLRGVRVALLEARMGSELAELVRRQGAAVESAPALREVPLDCAGPVAALVERLRTPGRRVHVFLTGAGATALLDEAERQLQLGFVVESLKQGIVVCRGPKPAAALKRYGIAAARTAVSPYTGSELLDAMASLDLAGVEVTLVHYGEHNEALSQAFAARGASLHELCVYEWRLPDDLQPLQDMSLHIIARQIDAVVFTSQVQWKHLLRIASDLDLRDALIQALNDNVVVASIGPICSAALTESGVRPHVVPENPKMAPLVAALARHFSALPTDPANPTNPTNATNP